MISVKKGGKHMKNRNTVVVAFLLAAVTLLGVGYAAMSDTLTIIGNAHIDMNQAQVNYDEKVYFSAAEALTNPTGDAVHFGEDDATFTANKLATKGDSATFKFTITNDSNVPVKINVDDKKLSGVDNPSNSNAEKFSVVYTYDKPDMTIPALGGTINVTVTVSVINPITTATSATFGIEFIATTVD
jgi:hypothetical protein